MACSSGRVSAFIPIDARHYWELKAAEVAAARHPAFASLSGRPRADFRDGEGRLVLGQDPYRLAKMLPKSAARQGVTVPPGSWPRPSSLTVDGDLLASLLRADRQLLAEVLTAAHELASSLRWEVLGLDLPTARMGGGTTPPRPRRPSATPDLESFVARPRLRTTLQQLACLTS